MALNNYPNLGGKPLALSQQTPQVQPAESGGLFGSVGKLLNNPMLMNLLAQSGYGPTPGSPIGAIGRAGVATQQQERQGDRFDLQKRLFESQIGLNNAKAEGELTGTGTPQTPIAKLITDHRNGLITDAQRDQQIASIGDDSFAGRQDRTTKLRGQFRTDTTGLDQSLNDLAKSKSLLQQGGPISDTAAFTSFIRSIDNSVVRPAEQAAYSQAGGAARAFEDMISKVKGSGPLSAKTRADLLGAVEAIESQVRGIRDRTVDYYNGQADAFSLDQNGVTGIPTTVQQDITLGGREDDDVSITQKAQAAGVSQELWEQIVANGEADLWR